MANVLLVAYYFPPVGGAGVQRALKFVQYLPAEGFLPTVITGPTSPDHRWTPHDRTLIDSIPPEVRVYSVEGSLPASSSRTRERIERCFGLPGSFSKWWIHSAVELGNQVADGQDVIVATMSPFESGEVARRLSQRFGIPWVADLRDPWALDEMLVYPSLLHRRLEMLRMERLLATAALIVMNTPESTAALKSAFPRLREKRVLTITNGFDQADFTGSVVPRHDGKFRIVHSGYLHTDNGAQLRKQKLYRLLAGAQPGVDILTRSHTVLLKAVEFWCAQRPEIAETLEIVFAGKTSDEDREVVNASPIQSLIRFSGYLPHHDSVDLIRTADVLFLPMHNLPGNTRSRIVPGKTYEYMAAGRPILAAVPDGDARDFLAQCGTAMTCRPDDAAGMADILDRLYSAWKDGGPTMRSNEGFLAQFERRNLTRTLANALGSVVPGSSKKQWGALDSKDLLSAQALRADGG